MRKLALLAAASFAATIATPAAATITFGNQTVGQGEEVLLSSGTTGNPVFGHTNQTNTSVTFTSGTTSTCPSGCALQILSEPANGQARIEATTALTGGTQIPLQDITIALTDLTNPLVGIGYIEFNIDNTANIGTAITVIINALDQLGNPIQTTGSVTLSSPNGSNFFSALASGGEVIRSISFDAAGTTGFTDIRQVRLTPAIGGEVTTPLPEPATWAMMIFGFGAAGMAMRRSRRKALLAQIA
jgi:PEP-CTERM motif